MTLFAMVRSLKRQHASQAAGFAAVAIAAAELITWWVGLPMMSSRGSGFATMKPMTALCLTALGLALVHPGKNSRFGLVVGLAVAAVAVLDLLDRFGIDSGINRLNSLLVPRAAVPGPETSFPMMNGVPVALALAGTSLALSGFERYHFAAAALGGLAGRSFCGSERRPHSARRDRCGSCRSRSDARSLRRSCCSACTREFASLTRSSARFGMD